MKQWSWWPRPDSTAWGWAILAGVAGAAIVLLMSLRVIDHAPHYDELFHVLAADGIVRTGEPVIASGVYTRGGVFTRAVAWSYRMFGESLVSARLPALAAGASLVLLLGVWMARRGGLVAGAASVAFLCLAPVTVDLAVFARFYTLHALVTTALFITLFAALDRGRLLLSRCALLVLAALLAALGIHLQVTTFIALAAAAAGAFAVLAVDHWPRVWPLIRGRLLPLAVGLGAGLVLVAWVAFEAGLVAKFRETALWASGNASRGQYYLVEFRRDMPLFWPMLPLAAYVALKDPVLRRWAVFCLVVLATALLAHSLAPMKSTRYVYYLLPLMCAVLGSAVAVIVTARGRANEPAMRTDRSRWALPVMILLALGLVFSQEGTRALNLLAGRLDSIERLPFADEPDWRPVAGDLAAAVRGADHIVTSNALKALYHLGRYDYELNASIVGETESGEEFGRDRRTGGRAIGRAESVARVLAEEGTTLVVIETTKIGLASGVSAAAFLEIAGHCQELPLSAAQGVRAWRCGPQPRSAGESP